MPVFTAAAAWIATTIGVSSALGVAAINFGVRYLATSVVSNLFTRSPDTAGGASAPSGSRIQLPPATNNKLSVAYGNSYMSPVIIDAKISDDQKYMWYVLAWSEVTDTGTITFDDPNLSGYPLAYWGDKQMQFDLIDKTKVTGLIDANGDSIDTRVDGSMYMYFYNNGSTSPLYGAPGAVTVLSDSSTGGGIPLDQRWSSSDQMTDTVFSILRIKYNPDADLTGLQQITALVKNSLYQPGSVIVDYLSNERYGCGMDMSLIDTAALTGTNGLDAYSASLISYSDNGVTKTQARYKINGPLDTSRDCLTNLMQLTDACDSWLQWNEQAGKWSVVINRSYTQAGKSTTDLFAVYCDTALVDTGSTAVAANYAYAIGGIDITPTDLNSTYNGVEAQFPSSLIKDQTDYAYINLPAALWNPNEPNNKLICQFPQVNDDVQAQYLATRKLAMARDDLIVSITTDYGGIQVDAGDIIRVYHKMYGWTVNDGFAYGKLFRVTQVQEIKTDDGNLGARLTLTEYNDTIYGDNSILAFQASPNTGITDPTIISTPAKPTVSSATTAATIPTFQVNVAAPAVSVGQVTQLEFWYELAATAPVNADNFKLWETQFYSAGPTYPTNYTQSITVSSLPASGAGFNYYWRVRAAGSRSKSSFSANSDPLTWAPNPSTTVLGQTFQATYEPTPVSVDVVAGSPDLANVRIRLFGLVGAGQVNFNSTQSNAGMANNEWRIDNANIVYNNITVGNPTDGGNFAQWPAPSALTANVATLTVPTIYKDAAGVTYAAPASIVNINKLLPGTTGSRGVVTLAYVPVTYDPTTATDTQLSFNFYATTGFQPPIDNDGAVFYRTSDVNSTSSRKYNAATTPKWQTVTLEVPGNVISANSISQLILKNGSVGSNQLINGAVTGDKIFANSITSDKIFANSVTAVKIQAGAVTAEKIDAGSITTDKLAAGSITTDKLSAAFVYAGNVVSFNADIGNNQSAGYWFEAATGNARIGGNLSVGGLITASQLNANTVTTEQLIIGSVTQSKSSIDSPEVDIVPWYNWPAGTANPAWPDQTRGYACQPVSIIPTTDPQQSANVQYIEGSRIQIGFTASIFSGVSGNAANTFYENYNLMELWRSGTTTVYEKSINSMRHSYNMTGVTSSTQRIQALGNGGVDLISDDGGLTWTTANAGSTTKSISGAISYYYTSVVTSYQSGIVGKLQTSDTGQPGTPTSNWGQRNPVTPSPGTTKLYFTINLSGGTNPYYYQGLNDACVTPHTGGNGVYSATSSASTSSGTLTCGQAGTITYVVGGGTGPAGLLLPYNTHTLESTGGTFQDLYSIYSNQATTTGAKNYTSVCVGAAGSLLRCDRTWSAASFSWTPKQIYASTGLPLLNDLYAVAGDDSVFSSTSKWVAVGKYATIMISNDNGENWTQVFAPDTVKKTLNAVRYCNGTWIIVGDEGVILASTNMSTWTIINSGLTTRNLLSVDYSPVHNRINVGGENIILNSLGGAIGNISFSIKVTNSASETYNLKRIWYQGSWPLTSQTDLPQAQNRIKNNQNLSITVIDTNYTKNQETTYFLIIGNLKGQSGATVWTGAPFLSVTEYKR